MKKLTLLLTFCTIFYNCYTYKPYDPEKDGIGKVEAKPESTKISAIRSKRVGANSDQAKQEIAKPETNEVVDPSKLTVKDIIKEKGYYSIEVFDKDYKIEAVKWSGDTLIAHQKGKPSKEYKFHEKDIQDLKIRKFSKGRSDALTVASYASAAVIIYLLIK